jgi:hypothetical protein
MINGKPILPAQQLAHARRSNAPAAHNQRFAPHFREIGKGAQKPTGQIRPEASYLLVLLTIRH